MKLTLRFIKVNKCCRSIDHHVNKWHHMYSASLCIIKSYLYDVCQFVCWLQACFCALIMRRVVRCGMNRRQRSSYSKNNALKHDGLQELLFPSCVYMFPLRWNVWLIPGLCSLVIITGTINAAFLSSFCRGRKGAAFSGLQ